MIRLTVKFAAVGWIVGILMSLIYNSGESIAVHTLVGLEATPCFALLGFLVGRARRERSQ
ncbi:MAG TPA: hypothetical protein VG056_01435 [Pirellulales bacterium]|jgi:hypothetical protein|nr:hypothetical protein [Pirellulales bacterium]